MKEELPMEKKPYKRRFPGRNCGPWRRIPAGDFQAGTVAHGEEALQEKIFWQELWPKEKNPCRRRFPGEEHQDTRGISFITCTRFNLGRENRKKKSHPVILGCFGEASGFKDYLWAQQENEASRELEITKDRPEH
ncbi:hypothetical protein WISP_01999 [Willisornis vidua]|uniref:Uncharacterized protein n=1 Tax=Willisornis vidua TaxID=1566151 RepID=A0ABQ9DUA1_9PASS|nr:hypothetical protein WISP_01999 [Willisornis vidua]